MLKLMMKMKMKMYGFKIEENEELLRSSIFEVASKRTRSAACSSRSAMTTFAPASKSFNATARPMFEAPPAACAHMLNNRRAHAQSRAKKPSLIKYLLFSYCYWGK